MRRLGAVLLGLAAVVGALIAGYALRPGSEPAASSSTTVATGTATVIRTDLVQTESLSGELRYTDPVRVRTALGGTVTSLPGEADRLDRGGVVVEIDGEPVFLFLGARPAWRAFTEGMDDGVDVGQLEQNLVALGFGADLAVDDEFDFDTGEAIQDWREAVGLPDAESLEPGRIVFLPEPGRVGSRQVEVGEMVAPGSPILEITGFDQQVVVDLDPDDLGLVAMGKSVVVILPDDRRVVGQVSSVGRVVEPAGPEPDAPGVIEVLIELAERIPDLDQAPVDVEVESDRARGVLAVPVEALIALSDGGYAVEKVDGTLVGVETGEFAGGLVGIDGEIAEGDQLVIAR